MSKPPTIYFMLCDPERGGCGHEIPLTGVNLGAADKIDTTCPKCRRIWQWSRRVVPKRGNT